MKVKIQIDTKTFVRFWLVVIGFALAVLAIIQAQTALIIIGVSLFFALALNAPVSVIAKRLPGKSRVGATALSYVAVVAVLVVVVSMVIPPIVQQTARFVESVPTIVESATDQWKGLDRLIDQYNMRDQVDQGLASIKNSASGWAANVGSSVVGSIGSIAGFFTASILVLVLTFLMLIEGPGWLEKIWSIYRNKDRMRHHKRIANRMYTVFNGYVVGQLSVSSIGAVAAGVVVFILSLIFPDIPANLAIPTATITFILSLIPMFGAMIGGIITTALLAFNAVPAAIIYAIYFVVYQQVENNWISPAIQSKRIDLSPLMVLVAVTIGLYMFGIVGGIISIPIAGCLRVLIDEYLMRKGKADAKPDKPLARLLRRAKTEEA